MTDGSGVWWYIYTKTKGSIEQGWGRVSQNNEKANKAEQVKYPDVMSQFGTVDTSSNTITVLLSIYATPFNYYPEGNLYE